MAKKSDRSESKKECPSCGLGVTEQAMICEFCGWDFEEEDEWILQIEKLERDLMLEKQRFEPGSVDHMIESTLRSPMKQKVEPTVPANEEAIEVEETPAPIERFEEPIEEPSTPVAREEIPAPEAPPAARPKVRKVRSVKAPPKPMMAEEAPSMPEPVQAPPKRTVRRVKTPAPAEEPVAVQRVEPAAAPIPEVQEPPIRKTRVVRKVKR